MICPLIETKLSPISPAASNRASRLSRLPNASCAPNAGKSRGAALRSSIVPASAPGPFLQALQVHLRQGLYVNAALNRLVAPKGAP